MPQNYWESTMQRRLTRRRAMIGTASVASAAAFLAACGGSDSKPAGTVDSSGKSSLVTDSIDVTAKAVKGGTLKEYLTSDTPTLDLSSSSFPLNPIAGHTTGTLLNEKPGHLQPPQGELYGDLAQSWEESPDHLTLTFKIKQNIKWHNKAPVNGRKVDIDDVIFSWKRFARLSPSASLSYNGLNPAAPILSVDAADSSTIVVKLKEPLAYAIRYFAAFGPISGNVALMPKEADGGFDPRSQIIGHGPYELSVAEPSVRYQVKRNAEYWDADSYFIDTVDLPVVSEYSTRLAQLKAGGIHRLVMESGLAQDLLATKKDQPNLDIYQTDLLPPGSVFVFGQLPAGKSPFLDERVRQAISMGIDRDAWIAARYNVDYFNSNGLPTETRWNSHMTCDWTGYWLDPKSKEFGENSKYFQYNVAEAKKLLAAAGFPNGFPVTSNYPVQGLSFQTTAEPIDGMLRDLGLNIKVNTPGYQNDYVPNYRDGKGQFEGWTYATVLGTLPNVIHPAAAMIAEYWPKGGTAFRGFSTGNANDQSGDPKLNAMLEKARLETDTNSLKSQLQEVQRYLAKAMWGMLVPGGATSFNMAWPAVKNHRTYRRTRNGNFQELDPYKMWIDQTQPPNKA